MVTPALTKASKKLSKTSKIIIYVSIGLIVFSDFFCLSVFDVLANQNLFLNESPPAL